MLRPDTGRRDDGLGVEIAKLLRSGPKSEACLMRETGACRQAVREAVGGLVLKDNARKTRRGPELTELGRVRVALHRERDRGDSLHALVDELYLQLEMRQREDGASDDPVLRRIEAEARNGPTADVARAILRVAAARLPGWRTRGDLCRCAVRLATGAAAESLSSPAASSRVTSALKLLGIIGALEHNGKSRKASQYRATDDGITAATALEERARTQNHR